MGAPSPDFGVTVRVEAPSSAAATRGLVDAVHGAVESLAALDIAESRALQGFGGSWVAHPDFLTLPAYEAVAE